MYDGVTCYRVGLWEHEEEDDLYRSSTPCQFKDENNELETHAHCGEKDCDYIYRYYQLAYTTHRGKTDIKRNFSYHEHCRYENNGEICGNTFCTDLGDSPCFHSEENWEKMRTRNDSKKRKLNKELPGYPKETVSGTMNFVIDEVLAKHVSPEHIEEVKEDCYRRLKEMYPPFPKKSENDEDTLYPMYLPHPSNFTYNTPPYTKQ